MHTVFLLKQMVFIFYSSVITSVLVLGVICPHSMALQLAAPSVTLQRIRKLCRLLFPVRLMILFNLAEITHLLVA